MHTHLFIPGPVDVREDVLAKMATPMIGHRSKAATALQQGITEKAQQLMYTKNLVVLSTSSGSGLMEAAIRCCTNKKAAVFSVGAFGDRWYDMAIQNNVAATLFKATDGEPTTPEAVEAALKTGEYDVVTVTHNETSAGLMNPVQQIGEVVSRYPGVLFLVDAVSSLGGAKIEVDKWGIDICITSTQKCLGLPPGLALASVSEAAYLAAKQSTNRGFYLDLVSLYDTVVKNFQYPSTPSLSHMYALDYQLDYILNREGLEQRFARHLELAEIVRAWTAKYFDFFAADGYRSNTVTCIQNTRNIDVAGLNGELKKRGFEISNGYGKFKDKTFRIAHMADCERPVLEQLLSHIEEILHL